LISINSLPHAVNCRRFCFFAPSVVCVFLFVYEIFPGTAERIWKTCLVPCLDEFEGQRSRLPGTKTAFFGPFGGLNVVCVW